MAFLLAEEPTWAVRSGKNLNRFWRNRLRDAQLRLDFARNFLKEVQRDFSASALPVADGRYTLEKALRAELSAIAEYWRVLSILTDLLTEGKPSDEKEWLGRKGRECGRHSVGIPPANVPKSTPPGSIRKRVDTPAPSEHT
jgi:hypothetical protein